MGKSRMAKAFAATMVVALVCGCAIMGKGPSDEELIMQALTGYNAAMVAQDLDKMMAAYSEDFEGENGESKDDVRDFFSGVIDQGYLEDLEVDMKDCEIKIEGGKAAVGPVGYSGSFGSVSFEYTMKKDSDGVWRFVETSMY